MAKPLHSHALDQAILSVGRSSLQRSAGGYGDFPRSFVALKTAARIISMGFATAHPRLGHKNSRLTLTAEGRSEFDKLRVREENAGRAT